MKIIGVELQADDVVIATFENGMKIRIDGMDEEDIEEEIEKRLKEITE